MTPRQDSSSADTCSLPGFLPKNLKETNKTVVLPLQPQNQRRASSRTFTISQVGYFGNSPKLHSQVKLHRTEESHENLECVTKSFNRALQSATKVQRCFHCHCLGWKKLTQADYPGPSSLLFHHNSHRQQTVFPALGGEKKHKKKHPSQAVFTVAKDTVHQV